jgi:MoaA/NifB/PqqE/SkfB family radical SAM enzyme
VFKRSLKDVGLDRWIGVIDELYTMGTEIIVLLGGEPLLYNQIDEVINHIKQYGMLCELVTNGYFVEKRIDAIKKLDSICLSLDGDEATNDRNRGEGSFRQAVTAIEMLKDSGIKTRIKAVVTPDNIESLDYLCRFASEHNLILTIALPCINQALKNSKDLKISTSQIRQLIKNIIKYKQAGYSIGYTLTCLNYVLKWPYDYYQWIKRPAQGDIQSILPCIKNDLSCYIDADGMMYHCAILWSNQQAKNIFEVGVKQAWQSLKQKPCYACGYISEVELNLLLSLSLRNIAESLLYFLKN